MWQKQTVARDSIINPLEIYSHVFGGATPDYRVQYSYTSLIWPHQLINVFWFSSSYTRGKYRISTADKKSPCEYTPED